jgi:hypothetical protein
MKNISHLFIVWLLLYWLIIPLFLVGIFCDRFNWKNIKKMYTLIFKEQI